MKTNWFLETRRLCLLGVFGLFLFAFTPLFLTGCAECTNDEDCGAEALCQSGTCETIQVRRRPPPPGGTECVQNEKRPCYSGPKGSIGKGVCKGGSQSCVGGKWGPCQGAILPQEKEACDNIDNNCNGQVDEGCKCTDGQKQKCYNGPSSTRNRGTCTDGEQICINGEWGLCTGEKPPQAEVCDNKDNDCNGLVDDGVKRACQTECGPGEELCSAGKFSVCNARKSSPEVCGDGVDNDCDGSTDEGCECVPGKSVDCYSGLSGTAGQGPCRKGKQTCSANGKWGACQGQSLPKVEICNSIDDDCNGRIDDNIKRKCQRGCNTGFETCQTGQWQTCTAKPADPEICDGKDNDCDGKVDNLLRGKCECRIGQKEVCFDGAQSALGRGVCKSGTRICQSTGKWSPCLGQITPTQEVCDGKDNNCDGFPDNKGSSPNPLTQECYSARSETAGLGICRKGIRTCTNQKWSTCKNEVTPKTETCNNLDDNCDGQIDENLFRECYSGTTGTDGRGVCKKGRQTCAQGKWGNCAGEVTPSAEQCNQKDDDCDGLSDENGVCDVCTAGEMQSCYTGPTNTRGNTPCRDGKANCISGQWGTCQNEIKPKAETCDNTDEDCDGQVDDGLSRNCQTACGTGKEICQAGQWVNCDAQKPKPEICNNLDDNCNGRIDDGINCTILATGDWSGTAFIWNPFSFQKQHTLSANGRVYAMEFSPNKQLLATGSRGNQVRLWDPVSGQLRRILNSGSDVLSLAFSPDSRQLAVGNSNDEIQIWDLQTGSKTKTLKFTSDIKSLVWHPQNKWIAFSRFSTVYFHEIGGTWRQLYSKTMGAPVPSIHLGRDGKTMLVGTQATSGKFHHWDVSSLPRREVRVYNSGGVNYDVRVSYDNTRALVSSYGRIQVWSLVSRQKIFDKTNSGHWYYSGDLSSDNRLIVGVGRDSSSSDFIFVWDLSAGGAQKFFNKDHTNYVGRARFRP